MALTVAELRKEANRKFGKNTIPDFSSSEIFRIPTGIFNLDVAIGGGIGRGTFSLFSGQESGGKSLTALKVIANAQKIDRFTQQPLVRDNESGAYINPDGEIGQPMRAAYFDIEGTTSPQWAQKIGIDIDEDLFVLVNSDFQENAYDIMQTFVQSGLFDIIVLDSIAAMAPEAELAASASDAQMGLAARGNNRGIRMAQSMMNYVRKNGGNSPSIILINQIREKFTMYGNPATLPGGKGQGYASALTVNFRAAKPVLVDKDMVGMGSTWTISKNKLNGKRTDGPFTIYFEDIGLYRAGDTDVVAQVVDAAIKFGLVPSAGAWFTVNEQRVHGRNSVEEYFLENPEYYNMIKRKILEESNK